MYAIVDVGNKQYKVEQNSIIDVDYLDEKAGTNFKIQNVLFASNGEKVFIGKPYLSEVNVNALILTHWQGKKVISFTYRRRKDSRVKKGYRHKLSKIKIAGIEVK
ncbi:MAG: 50S ribosomal protein L21 [Candidatus Omnitrophota bacterium]